MKRLSCPCEERDDYNDQWVVGSSLQQQQRVVLLWVEAIGSGQKLLILQPQYHYVTEGSGWEFSIFTSTYIHFFFSSKTLQTNTDLMVSNRNNHNNTLLLMKTRPVSHWNTETFPDEEPMKCSQTIRIFQMKIFVSVSDTKHLPK